MNRQHERPPLGLPTRPDPYDLRRFLSAQERVYQSVIGELRRGQKQGHWMWYIFPQLDGLGSSDMAKYFAIKSVEEARAYLAHPTLGARLRECAELVLQIEGRAISDVLACPDDLKLRSSMTLFGELSPPESVFAKVIAKYFEGQRDVCSLWLLEKLERTKGN